MAASSRILVTCALGLMGHLAPAVHAPYPQPGPNGSGQPTAYEVKAAYIFNLLPFTTWPASAFASADAPLNVCVATPDPFGSILRRTFESERVGTHPVAVKTISSPGAVRDCHVLFVGDDADGNGAFEQASQNAPVLTIGESRQFQQRGGIITFVIENSRVRFDVNQQAAARAGLQLSSKILQVARHTS